ncbi:uncharacterized protein CIMG_12586 [Coccidioides immitis RS]|uniref:Uncharacterized protein n=1 Tax=Coccidioides immitis (strain RS) TaxID=246410 RepID=J3K035_COCIM|nr:uncharacterized protein CIMG_12586 [Coccidioides immitis RS]EAS27172.3 hypothetical protein CIMG_12586 [Coccidioides immitis RS]
MAMVHCKCVMVNTNNIKLVLGIGAKIRLNYFGLIDAPDYPTPAATTHCLHAVSVLPTTAATASPPSSLSTTVFLSFPGAVRVSVCQMTDIRAPVWFTKLVLEKQKEKKEKKKKKKWKKKKKREKEDDNDDKDDDDDD